MTTVMPEIEECADLCTMEEPAIPCEDAMHAGRFQPVDDPAVAYVYFYEVCACQGESKTKVHAICQPCLDMRSRHNWRFGFHPSRVGPCPGRVVVLHIEYIGSPS